MPAGPELLGFAYFGAVKLVGYTLAGSVLRKNYGRPEVSALGFGLARTALGIAAGVSVGALFGAAGLRSSEILARVRQFNHSGARPRPRQSLRIPKWPLLRRRPLNLMSRKLFVGQSNRRRSGFACARR